MDKLIDDENLTKNQISTIHNFYAKSFTKLGDLEKALENYLKCLKITK